MYHIVSTSPTFGRYSDLPLKLLKDAGYKVSICPDANDEEKMKQVIGNADALIVGIEPVSKEVLASASDNLQVIAKHGIGVDNIDLEVCKQKGIVVANAMGASKHAVADYVIGLLLGVARRIPKLSRVGETHEWKHFVGTELHNKTIGVIGTGRIGKEVIKRAQGFSMNVIAYDAYEDESLSNVVTYTTLEKLFKLSDIITIHIDLNDESYKLIDQQAFNLMKETAILINTSRGGIVDEAALYQALSTGQIKAAALDVFEDEPAFTSPLFKLENFIGTPHNAAYTEEALNEVGMITSQNIINVLNGKDPLYKLV